MLALRISVIVVLGIMAWQDFKSRTVSILLFPLLTALLIFEKAPGYGHAFDIRALLVNMAFLIVQLLVLTIYFSLKGRTLVLVTKDLLGLGDLLFLAVCTVYFSVLNYIFFYLGSLFFALICWIVYRAKVKPSDSRVPLAGLQSTAFAAILIYSWLSGGPALTSDNWILHLMKWSQ